MSYLLMHLKNNGKFIFRCKVLVVGGGAGGCAMAAKLSSKLGEGKVTILEPADVRTKCTTCAISYITHGNCRQYYFYQLVT